MKWLAIILVLSALGCSRTEEYPHRFKQGDRVSMKLDGRIGIVFSVSKYWDGVDVRFAGDNTTAHTGILGGSVKMGTIPYSVITVRDWELNPVIETESKEEGVEDERIQD